MSTYSPGAVDGVAELKIETQAEASDRLLLKNSFDWVEHFATYADRDTAVGIYRRLATLCARMERERGFGRKLT